jgi:hypothetical protein
MQYGGELRRSNVNVNTFTVPAPGTWTEIVVCLSSIQGMFDADLK